MRLMGTSEVLRRVSSLHIEEGAEALAERQGDVAELYCAVFNGVAGIEPPWDPGRAELFLRDRTLRPGLVSVVLCDGARAAGACMGVLTRKADGPWAIDWDLLIHPDYRCGGLGRELYYQAHRCAERTALAAFGERPAMIEFSTYRRPAFPKAWWISLGHQPFPLFSAGLEGLRHGEAAKGITIRGVQLGDIEAIATLMAAPDVRDIDGSAWSRSRAAQFLTSTLGNPASVLRVAVAEDGIVGLIAADLVMRRSGPSLTQLTLIERHSPARRLTAALLAALADTASETASKTYGMTAAGLELTAPQARRLRPVLPDFRRDEHFIGMAMPFEAFMAIMRSRRHALGRRGPLAEGAWK